MTVDELKHAALGLPMQPGVYIMRDENNRVIYVGKAKKLKNRVSQYFQDTASHNLKTRTMVKKIDHFDVIVAASEFESLILECSLIKQYMPKYNILLKDDKGFPYLRLDMKARYPVITMVNRVEDDGACYYGPFGSRGVTNNVLQTIRETLKLPNCSIRLPRDIGKNRPCLNYHMNLCAGWCQNGKTQEDYYTAMDQARQLLQGDYKAVADSIKKEMLDSAAVQNFELAASLRDQLLAVEALGKKQLVTASSLSDTDVIGYAQTETKACFAVLHFRDGNLLDKDYELLAVSEDPADTVSSLMKQYYLSRGRAPRNVLLPFPVSDAELFSQMLLENFSVKTTFFVPARGDKAQLIALANRNASEEAERATHKEERIHATLHKLGKMLCIATPERIESFDVSNISGTDMVASMVVFQNGKPRRSEYKRFKINAQENQDDYAAMTQVLERRLAHLKADDPAFNTVPNLILVDGGLGHTQVAVGVLEKYGMSIPVFGMVKDDKHRTRALISPLGAEIQIDNQQAVFAFIGAIQEETHRVAITYHRSLRSKRLKYSELDKIPGVGPKRKQELLRIFKSIKGIREAKLFELEQYFPKSVALAVYKHFDTDRAGEVDKNCE